MSLLMDLEALKSDSIRLEAIKASGEGRRSFYLARPAEFPPKGLIVDVHGISRNAKEHVLAIGHEAAKRGYATLAPIFDKARYPVYQQLGRNDGVSRSDLALDAFVDMAFELLDLSPRPFFLSGFSGGAQFAHRYALYNPHRVRALGLAAAGWYTALTRELPFPHGLGQRKMALRQPPNLPGFLAIPTLIAVGENDLDHDPALRRSPRLDSEQGENRYERGQRWLQSVQAAGLKYGVKADRRFVTLARTGHDFAEAAAPERGNLAAILVDYFQAVDRREI